jgi:RNA polymerase sigma-70 factor (ECF subfamily)
MDTLESELVAQAAEGDRAAIQRLLVRHHADLVARVGAKLPADLQGVVSAEDVCQDAYVSVYQQISSLRDRSAGAFRSWLRAIAERKLVDTIRAMRAQKRGGGRRAEPGDLDAAVSSVIELLDMVALHEHTPSRSARRRELVSGVHKALDGLKNEYQNALRMHYIEGLSVTETAKRLDRTPGAVVMLCNRALKALAEQLGDPAALFSQDA